MRFVRISVVLILLSAALPAIAEEIIHFKTGLSMPCVSHTINDGMIEVDLGDNGFLAFPESVIDRIEVAGAHVALGPSYGTGANRRIPTPNGNYPAGAIKRDRTRRAIPVPQEQATLVEIDEKTGMAGYRPLGHSAAQNKRGLVINGNMRVFGNALTAAQGTSGRFGGTTQVGTRHVIGAVTPSRSNVTNRASRRPALVGFGSRGLGATPPTTGETERDTSPPPPPPADEN